MMTRNGRIKAYISSIVHGTNIINIDTNDSLRNIIPTSGYLCHKTSKLYDRKTKNKKISETE